MKKVITLITLMMAISGLLIADRDLPSLLSHEADVSGEDTPLLQLDLPPDVLEEVGTEMKDLRLFDEGGREIPWVKVGDLSSKEKLRESAVQEVKPLSVKRLKMVETEVPRLKQVIEIPPPPTSEEWLLEVMADQRYFVREIKVERKKKGEFHRLIESDSLFSLPDGGGESRDVVLPSLEDSLRITFQGEGNTYLNFRFKYKRDRVIRRGRDSLFPLEIVEIAQNQDSSGPTEILVEKAKGLRPRHLELRTESSFFFRKVRVYAEFQGRPDQLIGEGEVLRYPKEGVESLRIPVEGTEATRLRVVIDDAESPPLDGVEFRAVFPTPSIIFPRPPSSQGRVAILRYGGGRLKAARYDLEALRRLPQSGDTVDQAFQALRLFWEGGEVGRAKLGATRPNPSFDATPALARAMRPGSAIDPSAFARRRSLQVPDSPEGLTTLTLDAADSSLLQAGLGDLRIVDNENLQWPYLIDKRGDQEMWDIPLKSVRHDAGKTRFHLELEKGEVEAEGLELSFADQAYFDRTYELRYHDGNQWRVLKTGQLYRNLEGYTNAIFFPATRLSSLELWLTNGDEAPLSITGGALRVPVPRLYLVAPQGDYRLLIGADSVNAPRYDLERMQDVVLALPATEVTVSPLEPNPNYSRWSLKRMKEQSSTLLLWVILGVAVMVLVVLTLRMAKEEA